MKPAPQKSKKFRFQKPVLTLVVLLLMIGLFFALPGKKFTEKLLTLMAKPADALFEARDDPNGENRGPVVPPGTGNPPCNDLFWPLTQKPAFAPGYEIGNDEGVPTFVTDVYTSCFGGAGLPIDPRAGGFGNADVTMTVFDLPSTFEQIRFATETGPNANPRGWILSYVSVWDEDPEKNPNGYINFPGGCNIIHFRRRIAPEPENYRDEIRIGSLECNYAPELESDPREDGAGSMFKRQPEPDSNANPGDGYQGTMNQDTMSSWYRDKDSTRTGALTGHRGEFNFKWYLPYPGLLYRHLTLPDAGTPEDYRDDVVGSFLDNEKGNGEWDAADCGAPTNGETRPYDPSQPVSDSNPVTQPCPTGVPYQDGSGQIAWTHDEPYEDADGDGHFDNWKDENNNGTCEALLEDIDGDGDCRREEFTDSGNGYTPGDEWFYEDGIKTKLIIPELAWSRQYVMIGTSPRVLTVGDRHVTFPYDLGRIVNGTPVGIPSIHGEFETFSGRECHFDPQDIDEEDVNLEDQTCFDEEPPAYDTVCGFCGANQTDAIIPGTTGKYCEDKVSRRPIVVWPPFTANTLTFLKFIISPPMFDSIFESFIGDSTFDPTVDLRFMPQNPVKGEEFDASVAINGFSTRDTETFYAWLLNGKPQQGLAAGAKDPVKEYKNPPAVDGVEDQREFYRPPVRRPAIDEDRDGLDDDWERIYGGGTTMNPLDDFDDDGYVVNDYANKENPEAFIRITPGVWDTNGSDNPDDWLFFRGNQVKRDDVPKDFSSVGCYVAGNCGFTNLEEFVWGTNPTDADTDDDGFQDGVDIAGIGQSHIKLINQKGQANPAVDVPWDRIGVIALGRSINKGSEDTEYLVQLSCGERQLLPKNRETFKLLLDSTEKNPAPGKATTLTASVSEADIREGFLTYDWEIIGRGDAVLYSKKNAQGENTLTFTLPQAGETNYIAPGGKFTVTVTGKGRQSLQNSFGEEATVTKTYTVGNEGFGLQVEQNGQELPIADKAQLRSGIPIAREGDVRVTFADPGDDNSVLNSQYFFEWSMNDAYQVSQSGKGVLNFSFNPQDYLVTRDSPDNPVREPKRIILNLRIVDIATQKEFMRLEQPFILQNPGVTVQEVPADQSDVVLRAIPQYYGPASQLSYRWQAGDVVLAEGNDKNELHLAANLRDSISKIQLTVIDKRTGGATSTTEYLLQNQVRPTEDQTANFFRSAQRWLVRSGKFVLIAVPVLLVTFVMLAYMGAFKKREGMD